MDEQTLDNLLNTLKALGPTRIATLAVAMVVLLLLFSTVLTRVSEQPMSLLYGGMEQQEASKVASFLDSQNIHYEVRGDGAVYVPQDIVGEMRLKVAGEGLVGGSISGYEIFDKSSSFGTTSLVQNINARRALEGELARTISSLPIVKSVRVHLVMPKKRLFSKEKVVPTASVTLNVGGRIVDVDTVASIAHLVAASVPAMDSKHVTIVDQRGQLLSSGTTSAGSSSAIDSNSRVRKGIEANFESSISSMLERVVGNGKVSVSVNADIDFDRIEETSEIFDPDQQVVRSEQRSEGTTASQQSNGEAAVGVSGNVPSAGTTGTSVGSQENRANSEETINYEISKKARHYIKESGGIKKLSVAVLVEGRYAMVKAPVAEGEEPEEDAVEIRGDYIPYSDAEIAKFEKLIKSAIGYNEARGDSVQVIDMEFTEITSEEIEIPMFAKEDYFRIGELVLMFIGMFFIILFIIRPLMKAATKAMDAQTQAESDAILQGSAPVAMSADGTPLAAGTVSADGSIVGGAEDDGSLIDIASVEGKVRASSLKKVAELIETHPEESIGVVRSWMNADNAGGA
jgi:flagellar M-ring protein FliF